MAGTTRVAVTFMIPNEAHMTDRQRKAVRRIQTIIREEFHRGMLVTVYKGTDDKLHVQMISNCVTKEENIDLATRALQQVEKAETGIIKTLSNQEKRIITP